MTAPDRGRHVGPLERRAFTVTDDVQAQYLEALQDHHPRYLLGRGRAAPLVHPGALLNLSNATRSPSLGGPNTEWIHARDEVRFAAPAHVGEPLVADWRVDGHDDVFGIPVVRVSCVVSGHGGRQVVRRRSRAVRATGGRRAVPAGTPPPVGTARAAGGGGVLDLRGRTVRGREKRVTAERVGLFSDRRTRNIHNDEAVARAAGLAGPVVSAAQGMGYLCELMIDNFGEGWLHGGWCSLAFHAPVHPGDRLAASGTVHGLGAGPDEREVRLRIQIANQHGVAVTTGRATATWTADRTR